MRNPVTVVLMIVCVAAFATAFGASGAAGWFGIDDPGIGAAEDVDESEEELEQYKASREQEGVNFIGSVFSGFETFLSAFVVLKNLNTYLINAGVPSWFAVFVASPVAWSLGTFAIYFISGRTEVTPR